MTSSRTMAWVGQAAATSRKRVLVDRCRIDELGFEEVALSPLEGRRGENDAGAGADAAPPVDDDPHCHVTPALIAY